MDGSRLTSQCLVACMMCAALLVGFTTQSVHAASTLTVMTCTNGAPTSLDTLVAGSGAGDTINFSVDCPDPVSPIAPTAALVINHTLTIDGSGHTVAISGSVTHRVVSVTGGTLTINALTIEKGNESAANGGGIDNGFGSLVVTNSAFIDNVAFNGGGAIGSTTGTLTIVNSTFFHNSAKFAGAIYTDIPSTIINSTIAGNTATGGFGGGGLFAQIAPTTLTNTILAGNSAPLPPGANCATFGGGTIADGGHNLEFNPITTCGFAPGAPKFDILADPKLDAAPALNDGRTPTLKLLNGSAALDHGDPAACQNALPTGAGGLDQRGKMRFLAACSIGAYEPQAASLTPLTTPQSTPVGASFPLPLAALVADDVGNPLGGIPVTFAAPITGASGRFTGGVATATTNLSGVATAATFTANNTLGSYPVTASVVGIAPVTFSLSNISVPVPIGRPGAAPSGGVPSVSSRPDGALPVAVPPPTGR